jgi:hypothetical protein
VALLFHLSVGKRLYSLHSEIVVPVTTISERMEYLFYFAALNDFITRNFKLLKSFKILVWYSSWVLVIVPLLGFTAEAINPEQGKVRRRAKGNVVDTW